MRVVVVGAGLGGLSAAAHLVHAGHQVTVFERDARPGGRVGQFAKSGFRIDTGPTMLTMPDLLASTFAAAGAEMSDHLTLDPLDPMYRAVFSDGSVLHVRLERAAMAEEVRSFADAREAAGFERFCDWLIRLYEAEMPTFVDANYDGVSDALRRWRTGLGLVRQGGTSRLDTKIASFFEDERLQRVFTHQSVRAGLAPHDALAVFAVMTYMDTIGGVYMARGGTHAIATGLSRAIVAAGAAVRYSSPVTRILRGGDNAVTGVEIGGSDRVVADAVVCNADLPVAYRTLVGGVEAPRAARRGKFAPSCLLWVAGVRGNPPPGAAVHNLYFGDQWHDALRAVIKRGVRMTDPSIQVTMQSIADPGAAPPGCSSIYALEPVPNLDGKVDWARDGDRFADDLRRRVGELGFPVEVVAEQVFDPLDWEALGLERGTPWSLSHTLFQTGPFRPNNIDERVPGLVFAGASTVPGAGVPMVLVSGKLAAQRVEHYARHTSIVRW